MLNVHDPFSQPLTQFWVSDYHPVVYGADTSSLTIYGVIHISIGHITAQVRILGISYYLLIYTFHLTLWVACIPLESPLAYNMYLFYHRIANYI